MPEIEVIFKKRSVGYDGESNVSMRRTQEVLGSRYKAARTAPLTHATWGKICEKNGSLYPLVLTLTPQGQGGTDK
jgi:hypothetical protein